MPFYHRPPRDRGPLRPRTAIPAHSPLPADRGTTAPTGYAVIDLETTGLSPTTDSILEIGLVLAGHGGEVERSWSTLINPGAGTDVGPTFIHGIVSQDLVGAPSLESVADLLVADLAGRAVVAHNARFDVGFLTQALGVTGRLARGARVPRVCTMEWSRHFMTTPSRRLVTCCEVAGVRIGQHHSALDDALAATGLLRHYLAVGRDRGEEPVAWDRALTEAAQFSGWTWDRDAAAQQVEHLVPRRSQGVPREGLPGHL